MQTSSKRQCQESTEKHHAVPEWRIPSLDISNSLHVSIPEPAFLAYKRHLIPYVNQGYMTFRCTCSFSVLADDLSLHRSCWLCYVEAHVGKGKLSSLPIVNILGGSVLKRFWLTRRMIFCCYSLYFCLYYRIF